MTLTFPPRIPARPNAPTPPPRIPRHRQVAATLAADLRVATKWPALDGLRGVAVLAVVGWHVWRFIGADLGISRTHAPMMWWPMGIGRLGVDIFFVLSGLLVVRSWNSVRCRASSLGGAVVESPRRRARRVLPAYWVSLAVLIPLVAADLLHEPRRLALFATVNAYVRDGFPGHVNMVYWSLTTEWHFYLLVPFVAWLLLRLGRWPALLGCLALSFAWWTEQHWQLPPSSIFGRLDQFVAGAVVGDLVREYERGKLTPWVRAVRARGAGIAIVAAAMVVASYHGSPLGASRHHSYDALLHPVFGLIVAAGMLRLTTRTCPSGFGLPVLRLAGLVSFSLYLWHYPILKFGMQRVDFGGDLAAITTATCVLALCLAVVMIVTVASYLLVERPFLDRRATKADGASDAAVARVDAAA